MSRSQRLENKINHIQKSILREENIPTLLEKYALLTFYLTGNRELYFNTILKVNEYEESISQR